MTDRPMLFSAPMVRAFLAGTKDQTRRLVKPQPEKAGAPGRAGTGQPLRSPYGYPGDLMWVRENFRLPAQFDGHKPINVKPNVKIHYEANGAPTTAGAPFGRLRPCIHLPRVRSRITRTIAAVRVERLQSISEADAAAEGIRGWQCVVGASCDGGRHVEQWDVRYFFDGCDEDGFESASEAYQVLWTKLHGAASWEANPWVWVISFRPIDKPDSARAPAAGLPDQQLGEE